MNNPFLTVITPTYNRAHLLTACFDSLCRQTDFSFEWIIVDDGSTDNTEQVVERFSTSKFTIKYVKKNNGGKHTALNVSHPYINGKYVLILDSDDTLTVDAVASVKKECLKWFDDKDVGVITFLKINLNGEPLCTVNDYDVPVDLMTCQRNCLIGNDCCEVVRTDLFKKYLFPVFENEYFLAEGVLWAHISYESKCVYINKGIYKCEYLGDGLTKAGRSLRIKNPLGGMCHAKAYMASKNRFKLRIKNSILYSCYGFFAKMTISDMLAKSDYRFLTIICLPLGWFLYLFWSQKYIGKT